MRKNYRSDVAMPVTHTQKRSLHKGSVLALAAVATVIVATPLTPAHTLAHAAMNTIVAPTYVRTVGGQVEAITYPSGVAVDAAGNVYVADTGNYKIEKWAAGTGSPTQPVWSVGVRGAPIGGGTDSFQAPRDVATDGTFVYVADTDNAVVQVLNASNGSFVKEVRTFGASQKFSDPIGISVGSDGSGHERILVSDGVSGNVYMFDASFTLTRTIKPTAKNEGTRDAATDSAGTVYTADYRGNAVDTYSRSNNGPAPTSSWGSSSTADCHDVAKPYGVQVDTADTPNRIYVASSDLEQVKVFNPTGTCRNVGATGSNAIGTKATASGDPTKIFQLRRVAVGAGSNPLVYAADLWGLKILTYNSSDGTIASTAQPAIGDGQYPPAGNLNEPHGLALATGTTPPYIFTTNTVNQRMERFNLDGSNPIDWGTKGVAEGTASFNWAQGVAFDAANGNVWVANTRNNRIDEFSTTGTLVGSFPAAGRLNSIFNWPMAVTFDPAGNMYVADTFHSQVDAFSVTGTTVNTTPLWKSAQGQFTKPWGLAYDATQSPPRLLVADTGNSRIVSLNASTGALNGYPINVKGTAAGDVIKPQGVAVDAAGHIWVADTGNNRIEEFTSTGAFANQMIGTYGTSGNASFSAPQSIAFDSSGLLYVTDPDNNRIQVYQPAAVAAAAAASTSAGAPTYSSQIYDAGGVAPLYPAGGAADAAGNMYLADSGRSAVDKVDPSQKVTYITPATGLPLSNPRNLSLDISDSTSLWISNTGNNEIVEMSTAGNVLHRFRSGTVSGLSLKSPFGIANDATGVYIADTYHNRIIKLSKTDGHVLWARASCTTALSRPRDLTVGSDGNIYVVDTDHARVVELDISGACVRSWRGPPTHTLKAPRALTSDGNGGLWIVEAGGAPALVHISNDGLTYIGGTRNGGNFLEPEGVFLLNASTIEVADPFAFQLDTFTAAGANSGAGASGVLNKGGPVVGGFNNPFGVAYDSAGNLYVSDMFNQRIEKFPPSGGGSPTATGEFGGGVGHMQNPRGIAVTPDGTTVILTNSEDNRIDLFKTSDLSFIKSIAPTPHSTCGKMFWPDQTAYDPVSGTYWVADTNNNRIVQLDGSGVCLQNWTGTGVAVHTPRGIAWDGTNVWVANTTQGQILKCTTSGGCVVAVARPKIKAPWNMTVANGNLYVADANAGKIDVFALDGSLLFSFGSLGSNSNAGQFLNPRAVAVSSSGVVAVADFQANLISLWH